MEGDSFGVSNVEAGDSLGQDLFDLAAGGFPGGPFPLLCGFGCLSEICAPFFFFLDSPLGVLSPGRGDPGGFGEAGGASPPSAVDPSEGASSTMAGVLRSVSYLGGIGSGTGAEMRWQKLRMKCAWARSPRCSWSKAIWRALKPSKSLKSPSTKIFARSVCEYR